MPKDNIPEIRVRGFSDEWKQRKLGEIGEVITGSTPSTQHPEYYSEDGMPWVTPTDIVDNIIYDTPRKLSPIGEKVGRVVPADTILVTCIASIGKNAMLVNTGSFNQQINSLVPDKKKYDPYFLLTESFHWSAKMKREAAAGTMQIVNKNEFSAIETYVPELSEQKAIGAYFCQIDKLITLHQHKYESLVAVKKAMLEKMFPKEGETVPEIRFAGFTDPWEQRKLGDCFTERVESMPDGELISVTINDGIKKFSELGRHDNSNDDKSKYKKVCVGDIAYNSMRMWQGASGYSPYEGIVSPAYTVLSPNSGINSKCLAYQFKLPEIIHTFQVNSQGITSDNWNLKYPALSQIEIFVSKDEQEQAKIAKYFENLDNLITLHQRKCEVLKNLKSALLNKMFL